VAARGKRATRHGSGTSGGHTFLWFAAGLVLGLVLAVVAFQKGMIPQPTANEQAAARPSSGGPALLGDDDEPATRDSGTRYDFFTVLPEMEVVVPERELTTQAQPQAVTPPDAANTERFVLQAGSFRSAADADQMKARLALLGSIANVQKVTVDQQTWHRVRIGPVTSAREADQLRRQLQENGIEVLVMKVTS
jgi:cell division protein FtsN